MISPNFFLKLSCKEYMCCHLLILDEYYKSLNLI